MLINNYHIKEILLFFYKNEKNTINDYELFFFKKAILSLLNNINPYIYEYDINNCVKSYNKLNKLYLDSNEFILNEKQKLFSDILLNNNINNYELLDITKFMNINKNKTININNSIDKNILNDCLYENKSNFKNIILEDFNKINPINEINPINDKASQNHNNSKYVMNNGNSHLKQKKNIFKVVTKTSRYRGVTKNKRNWQVYIRINSKNYYLGSYSSEKTAAKIYDIMAIKKNGIKAKTNFKYTSKQIKKISKLIIDIDSIYDIADKMDI